MSDLKSLALKAKNRLLSKGLRDTYSHANVLTGVNMNNNNERIINERSNVSESPFKYLLREDKMMTMTPSEKERFILNSIRIYQQEKRNQQKDII